MLGIRLTGRERGCIGSTLREKHSIKNVDEIGIALPGMTLPSSQVAVYPCDGSIIDDE